MLLGKENLSAKHLALISGTILTFIVCSFKIFGKPDNGKGAKRVPLVKYRIPWLGSAIELGSDPDGVFKRAAATFGPVFRIQAAGREFTYVTAPNLISAIYRDSKTFQFTPIRIEITHKIFGSSPALTQDPVYYEDYYKAHHEELSPIKVVSVLQRYGAFTYEALQKALDKLDDNSGATKLSFIKPAAYDAAAYAFFGKAFPSEESYEPFKTFDEGFLLLQTDIPRFFLKKPIQAREKLFKLFENYLSNPHDDCAGIMHAIDTFANKANWSLRDQCVSILGDLWALQSNAVQAAYWIIALQLQRPEGLSHLIKEIDTARTEWLKNNSTTNDETRCQWILDSPLPLLTSTIQEILRYATMSFSIRIVEKETVLGGYYIPKGDYLICNTRLVHLDGDIHSDSTEFIPDRYMRSTKFTKDGRTVPNHTIPFGGGVSMCEGRHFAQGELKVFIALLLTLATIEIDPSSSERPKFNYSHMGTGMIPPVGDFPIRVTRRAGI